MAKTDKKIVLLVEDEILIAMDRSRQLSDDGYTVIHVMNGEAAVRIVGGNNDIDLILMDIDLGRGIDGIKAAEIILENKNIPIIFLTNRSKSEVSGKINHMCSCSYVLKSSGAGVLNSAIKKCISGRCNL